MNQRLKFSLIILTISLSACKKYITVVRPAPKSCSYYNQIIPPGGIVTGFATQSPLLGEAVCQTATAYCTEAGNLNRPIFDSCNNWNLHSCSFNDETIPHGASINTYFHNQSTNQLCSQLQETRTCSNGVLSGSATETSCSELNVFIMKIEGNTYSFNVSNLQYEIQQFNHAGLNISSENSESPAYIDWGDGTVEAIPATNNNLLEHFYPASNNVEPIYTIKISGRWQKTHEKPLTDNPIQEIIQWGNNQFSEISYMFYGQRKYNTIFPSTNPDWTQASDMQYMFAYSNINRTINFNTSNITNMSHVFFNDTAFNSSVDNWNTVNVLDMSYLFAGCRAIDVAVNFNTSKVTNMEGMFYSVVYYFFDVTFDTSNVTNMSKMFMYTYLYGDLNFSNLEKLENTSQMFFNGWIYSPSPITIAGPNLVNIDRMFTGTIINQKITLQASAISSINLFSSSTIYISPELILNEVQNSSHMFDHARIYDDLELSLPNNEDASSMFKNAGAASVDLLISADNPIATNANCMFCYSYMQLINVYAPALTNGSCMFCYANIKEINLNTPNLEDASYMFYKSIFNGSIDFIYAPNIQNMSYMFAYSKFNQPFTLPVINVSDMSYMFFNSIFNQPLNLTAPNVTSLKGIFEESLYNSSFSLIANNALDLSDMFKNSSFNAPVSISAPKATNLSYMFFNNASFNSPNYFNTPAVENLDYMFYYAANLNNSINFSDLSSAKSMERFLSGAVKFNQPINWNTSNVTNFSRFLEYASDFNSSINLDTSSGQDFSNMFYDAVSFNQPLNFNTVNAKNMNLMFYNSAFDQDISNWCVPHVQTYYLFDSNTSANWTSNEKPQWGTCPTSP